MTFLNFNSDQSYEGLQYDSRTPYMSELGFPPHSSPFPGMNNCEPLVSSCVMIKLQLNNHYLPVIIVIKKLLV